MKNKTESILTNKYKYVHTKVYLNEFRYKLFHVGTAIDAANDISELKELIKIMEKQDKEDGVFFPNSYLIHGSIQRSGE